MGGAALLTLLIIILTKVACEIVFDVEPNDVLTATDSSVRFDCTFTTTSPPASLSWLRDGAVITSDSRHTFLTNGSLQISSTAEEDEGEYTCRVTETSTDVIQERRAALTLATILDSFLVSPDATTVDEGEPLQLFCIHSGSLPAADITWLLNGITIVSSLRISILSLELSGTDPPQTSSSLYISSSQPSDAGSYTCEARNDLLPDIVVTSSAGEVTVIGAPRPPTITEHPSDATVIPGTTATFTCSASGQPSPGFTWYHDGGQLTSEEVSISSNGGRSTLRVSAVGEEEEGEYRCRAQNTHGTADSDTALLWLAYLDSVFQLAPADTVAIMGSDARLDCLPPDSSPTATISWTKDFTQLPSARFTVLSNGSLLISSVTTRDQAVYHCVANNELLGVSSTSDGAQLTVLAIPTVTPDIISVSIGQSVTFRCETSSSLSPSLVWYNGSTEITPSTPRTTLTSSTLTLEDIVREDQGEYVCTANYLSITTQATAMLLVNAPPLFVDSNVSLTTIEGQEVTLPCATLPDHTLTFSWSFNDIPILLPSDDEESPTLLSSGSLHYSTVVDGLEGNYTCEASNSLGSAKGIVHLTVFVPPSLTPSPPIVTITEGQTALLTCTVTAGDPVPVLVWYHVGTLIPEERETTLRLEEVEKEQEGLYECSASNDAGDDSATITLVVNTHPTVVASPSLLEVLIGSTATFLCVTSGDPTPLTNWYNEDDEDVMSLGDPRVQLVGDTLVISNIRESDSQLYTCTASNVVGSTSSTVQLNVLVPPAVSLPPSIVAPQGDPLSLDCGATGTPPPTVVWYKDGRLLSGNGRVTVSPSDRVVTITSLHSIDEGNYTCVASNRVGGASATSILTVLVIPVIHAGVAVVTVTEGDTAVLGCNATGNPPPTVYWFHSSLPVPIPGDTRLNQADNDSLVVRSVVSGDGGQYVCQATNIAGSDTATLLLVVYVVPMITPLETSITVVEGSEVSLSCTATGHPTPVVTWLRRGGEVPNESTPTLSSVGGEGEGSLVISPVVEGDGGEWMCVGTNIAGSNQQAITLSVLVPPTITSLIPSVTITEGTSHTLTCAATGEPHPLVSWSRGGVVISSQGSLSLAPAQRSDADVYTCTATNTAGSDSGSTTVDILYPPTITQSPDSQTAHLHSLVEFHCIANGNPDPIISWNHQGALIEGVQGNILTVPSVGAEDVGTYTCVATNTVDEVTANATLTVLFPPSSPSIEGAVATSSTTVSIQWAPSTDDGGSPLTNYVVEYRLTDESAFSDITTESADILSMTISGLTPFGQYELRVRGENVVGRGDPSNSVLAQTHPAAPSAPGDLRVVSSTPSSLTLAWTLPDPLNGQFGAYELQYGEEENFDNQRQTRFLFVTQYVVTGLVSGVTYLFRVRASTISLRGETLWGPHAILQVRDGDTLEIPTPPPSSSASPTPPFTPSPQLASTSTVVSSQTTSSMATSPSSSSPSLSTSSSPLAPVTTSTPSQPSLPTSSSATITSIPPPSVTPTNLSLSATPTPSPSLAEASTGRDSGYYIVRILPPLLGVASIAIIAVPLVLAFRYNWKYRLSMQRRGIYKLSGAETGSEFELGTKVNEGAVAGDDLETSVYYVKNALDANVTYTAGPAVHTAGERTEEGEEEGEGEMKGEGWGEEQEDVDMPDMEVFHGSDGEDCLLVEGRDALQESPSHAPSERPDSVEFPSLPLTHTSPPHHVTSSHTTGGRDSPSRPIYQPGDYSYAELDAIRARKVQHRVKRFHQLNPESTGYSSGGLMETRIGAMGGMEETTRESPLIRNGHITPGELAHMY